MKKILFFSALLSISLLIDNIKIASSDDNLIPSKKELNTRAYGSRTHGKALARSKKAEEVVKEMMEAKAKTEAEVSRARLGQKKDIAK